jgi:hypothetical protein
MHVRCKSQVVKKHQTMMTRESTVNFAPSVEETAIARELMSGNWKATWLNTST